MYDAAFINEMLQKAKEAAGKVNTAFSGMTVQQLNWKPDPGSWSIAQCLEHLVISGHSYFPIFKKITDGQYKMTTWEKWSPFSALFGRMLVNSLQEQVTKKMKAPRKIRPSASAIDQDILQRFHEQQDIFLKYIAACDKVNVDDIYITSPMINFVTYNLRDAIRMLVQHEHRHINQAIRVKEREGFPV